LNEITMNGLEMLLMFYGCSKNNAEEAIEEASYRLLHSENPEGEIFNLICYWANYISFYEKEEHDIKRPGDFIASRVKKIRTPPNQYRQNNPIIEIILQAILFAQSAELNGYNIPRGRDKNISNDIMRIIQNQFPDIVITN